MRSTWVRLVIFVVAVSVLGYFILPDPRQRGHQLAQDREYRRAINAYEQALVGRSDKDSVDILNSLVELYIHEGMHDKAIGTLQRLVALEPDRAIYLEKLAVACTREPTDQNVERAISAYERLTELAPRNETYLEQLASICLMKPTDRNVERAISAYERLAELNPNDTAYLEKVADLYLWQKRFGQAAGVLEKLVEINPDPESYRKMLNDAYTATPGEASWRRAIATYERLVRKWPDKEALWLTLADYHKWNNDPAGAIPAYKELTRLKPAELGYWTGLVELCLWSNNYDGAIDAYTRMRKAFPDRPEIVKNLGMTYAAVSKEKEAIIALEDYIVLQPADEEMRKQLVNLYVYQSRPVEAVVHRKYLYETFQDKPEYREALIAAYKDCSLYGELVKMCESEIRKSPLDSAARLELAGAYAADGRVEEAIGALKEAVAAGAVSPETYRMLATLQRESGRIAEEREALIAAVEKFPDDPQFVRRLARTYEDGKEFEDAMKLYEKLLALNPQDTAAQQRLVLIYTALLRPSDAIAQAKSLLDKEPANRDVLEQLTNLYEWTGDVANAAEIWRRAVLLDPQDQPGRMRLAQMYTRLERHREAAREMEELVRLDPASIEYRLALADAHERAGNRSARALVFEAIVALDPNNVEYQITFAEALSDAGQYDRAVEVCRRLLAADPGSMQFNLLLAAVYEDSGRMLEAIAIHTRLAEMYPKDPDRLIEIGERYMWIGDRERARLLFERALGLDPNNLRAIKELGRISDWNNDLVKAQDYYNQFIALGGKDYEVHFLLGELLYDNGLPGPGYDQEDKALELIRKGAPDMAARLAMARIRFRRGELLEAIRTHEELVREYPADLQVREDYLETLVLAGEFDRAQWVAAELLERFPRSERGARLLGRVYTETGRYDDAVRQIEGILAIRPDDPGLKFDLARAYMETGRMPQALPLLQQALASGVDTADEIQAIRDLYATALATRFGYLHRRGSRERFEEATTLRHWLDESTRLMAEVNVSHYRQPAWSFNRKISRTVTGEFLRVDHDLNRIFRGYGGVGLESGAGRERASYLVGAIVRPTRDTAVEISHSSGRVAVDPFEFLNFNGREERTALEARADLSRRWKAAGGAAWSRYKIDGSKNVIDGSGDFGNRSELYSSLEYVLMDTPHYLSAAYGFRWSRFDLENGALEQLVPVLTSERAHTLTLRWGHQDTKRLFHGVSVLGGYDTARVLPLWGAEGELTYRFSEDLKGEVRTRYLGESGTAGGGSEFEVTAGLEWQF